MLRCRDIVQHADRYMAGEMGFWPRLGFRVHLLFCRFCRRYLHQLGVVTVVSADMPAGPAAAEGRIDAVVDLLMRNQQAGRALADDKDNCGCPNHHPDSRA